MSEKTGIAWCDATFNPWWGCVEAGPECDSCYAREFSQRIGRAKWGRDEPRVMASEHSWAELRRWNEAAWTAGKRRRVFVASMGDVLENRRDLDAPRLRLWGQVEVLTSLDFLLLTKRPTMFAELTPAHWRQGDGWPRNAWAGTTCGHPDQTARVSTLLEAAWQAPVRFVSAEPLLGPIEFDGDAYSDRGWLRGWHAEHAAGCEGDCRNCPEQVQNHKVDWVIVGGESGRKLREMDLSWLATIAEECKAAGTPLFVKQDSALRPGQRGRIPDELWIREFPA